MCGRVWPPWWERLCRRLVQLGLTRSDGIVALGGGVTGDLAGFFLQLCELGMVLCAAVGQRLEVLL